MKIADTPTLIRLNQKAIELERNRAFSDSAAELLDPEGVHVCSFSVPHEHAGGQKVEPHVRTMWLCAVRTEEDPITLFVDIESDDFEALDDADV